MRVSTSLTSLDLRGCAVSASNANDLAQVLLASPSLTDLQLDPAAQLGAASSITFRNASPSLLRPLLFLPEDCKATPDNSAPDNSEGFSDGDLARLRAAPSPVCEVTFSIAPVRSLFFYAAEPEGNSCNGFSYFCLNNGSSHSQNLAVTVLFVPGSLDSGLGRSLDLFFLEKVTLHKPVLSFSLSGPPRCVQWPASVQGYLAHKKQRPPRTLQ